jgi:hypothetical protein
MAEILAKKKRTEAPFLDSSLQSWEEFAAPALERRRYPFGIKGAESEEEHNGILESE